MKVFGALASVFKDLMKHKRRWESSSNHLSARTLWKWRMASSADSSWRRTIDFGSLDRQEITCAALALTGMIIRRNYGKSKTTFSDWKREQRSSTQSQESIMSLFAPPMEKFTRVVTVSTIIIAKVDQIRRIVRVVHMNWECQRATRHRSYGLTRSTTRSSWIALIPMVRPRHSQAVRKDNMVVIPILMHIRSLPWRYLMVFIWFKSHRTTTQPLELIRVTICGYGVITVTSETIGAKKIETLFSMVKLAEIASL